MKVVYCLTDSSRIGGIERSICCKANYLADVAGYNITIITTDRKSKNNFYNFSSNIQFIDLDINYDELNNMSTLLKYINKLRKRKAHKNKLSNILSNLNPDVIISTYAQELTILPKIKILSKKLVEIHYSRFYKEVEYNNKSKFSIKRIITLIEHKCKQQSVKKYDSIVVLTKKEKQVWGGLSKIEIIPNILPFYPKNVSDNDHKRVISIGKLTYIKGYHLLIEAWSKVAVVYPDWKLSIIGDGAEKTTLQQLIHEHALNNGISILASTQNIEEEYLNSSLYVMSSLTEGFGIVLIEAMACGLPCISFDCPNGPSEVITHGEDGLLVEYGNTDKLAKAIIFLIEDNILRKEMSETARENVRRFLPERIMPRWITLFEQITGTSEY